MFSFTSSTLLTVPVRHCLLADGIGECDCGVGAAQTLRWQVCAKDLGGGVVVSDVACDLCLLPFAV